MNTSTTSLSTNVMERIIEKIIQKRELELEIFNLNLSNLLMNLNQTSDPMEKRRRGCTVITRVFGLFFSIAMEAALLKNLYDLGS